MAERSNEDKKRVWGLTGSIGSGKSAVEQILRKYGATVIDADAISKELTSGGHPFLKELVKALGKGILNSNGDGLDRQKCRDLVASDPQFKKKLESILHPEIAQESSRRIGKALRETKSLVIYSAALLLEAKRHTEFPNILLVTADDSIRLNRVMERDGATEDRVKALMAVQMSQDDKRRFATYEIVNNGTISELEKAVKAFFQKNA